MVAYCARILTEFQVPPRRATFLNDTRIVKLLCFNINGIRARPHQLERIVRELSPDVIGLQETKVEDGSFPAQSVVDLGYEVAYHGQKGHYGVALLSRRAPLSIRHGMPGDAEDAQRRLIVGEYADANGDVITVINGYFPQGESADHPVKFPAKQKFYADLLEYLHQGFDPARRLVVMGDFNVAYLDKDIGIGDDNRKRWLRTGKCCFLPQERDWFGRLLEWGLVDVWRHHHPDEENRFSWFDYRSAGFERDPPHGLRIDGILATQSLVDRALDSGISYDIRAMQRPSDHCPVWVEFDG